MASAMGCPCETRTSTCRNFATISSGLYRFLAITVLLDVKDIPQVGPLQWGWITCKLLIHNQKFNHPYLRQPRIQVYGLRIQVCGLSGGLLSFHEPNRSYEVRL